MAKIRQSLPYIFDRPCPSLEPSTETSLALLLLSFHETDALPIGFRRDAPSKKLVVSGYSCLSKLLETDPQDYARFLYQPCKEVSVKLPTVFAGKDIETLLEIFRVERFGIACVEEKSEIGRLVSLRDLLALYEKSIFRTDLAVGEVASSPVFSLPGDTSLKQALKDMFKREIRRVFVSETQRVVSDREILDYVFSASRLGHINKNPTTLLDAKLSDVKSTKPESVSATASINRAAVELCAIGGGCLICDKGVVTPWNMIIKPWSEKKLTISAGQF